MCVNSCSMLYSSMEAFVSCYPHVKC
jgi:hypothetical protein